MNLRDQINNLTTEVSELRGTVNSLVAIVSKLEKGNGKKVSLKPVISIVVVCFVITSTWLSVITAHLLK